MKFPKRITVLIVALSALFPVPIIHAADKSPLDERLAELFLEYHDVASGKFRNTRVGDLLKKVKEFGSFHQSGFTSLSTTVTCWSYWFDGTKEDPSLSRYGFEFFTIGSGSDVSQYEIIGVRLSFLSPSKTTYYNNILPINDIPPHVYSQLTGPSK